MVVAKRGTGRYRGMEAHAAGVRDGDVPRDWVRARREVVVAQAEEADDAVSDPDASNDNSPHGQSGIDMTVEMVEHTWFEPFRPDDFANVPTPEVTYRFLAMQADTGRWDDVAMCDSELSWIRDEFSRIRRSGT